MKHVLMAASLLLAGARLSHSLPEAGMPAPALPEGQDLSGKIVLLDFWASWCEPCARSFPWLDSLQIALKEHAFTVIAVNEDRKWAKAERFLKEGAYTLPVVHDKGGKLAAAWGLEGMPSSFLIDETGTVRFSHVGFREGDSQLFEKEIDALLKAVEAGR